jgi:Zn-finger nucleic acid-binding protein
METAVKKAHLKRKDVLCPRDKSGLHKHEAGEAELDVCGKCGGQFFDSGEMFASFGIKADPSYWDRPETGGTVKDSEIHCPLCGVFMLTQDVKYEDKSVEIDRCGKCGGIWLDKGEVQSIMTISEKLWPVLDEQRRAAQAEADKIPADFGSPGLIGRFLKLFQPG